jgi:hypothetical protein
MQILQEQKSAQAANKKQEILSHESAEITRFLTRKSLPQRDDYMDVGGRTKPGARVEKDRMRGKLI